MTTKILVFHPKLDQSRANAAMIRAAQAMSGVEVIDMVGRYAGKPVDVVLETRRLLAAERLVLQFPVQWYAPPAALKQWLDDVFTAMYYVHYADSGRLLEGMPVLVAATAGNLAEAYTPAGQNFFSLPALLQPLEATAFRCKLPWYQPFLAYRANKLDAAELEALGQEYCAYLERWRREQPARSAVVQENSRAAGRGFSDAQGSGESRIQ